MGTRGSKLALRQGKIISELLEKKFPDLKFEMRIIKTTGDKIIDAPLAKVGGKGVFVKEIDEAVVKGEVDFAVHSMKDVPTEMLDGIEIVSVPKREEVNDVLVSKEKLTIDELPRNAVIGTSSIRRKAMLLNYRNDYNIKSVRGNVDTRIRKVLTGEYDAIIMARAGLKRLGLIDYVAQTLPTTRFLPSVGQGAIAIVARSGFEYMDILKSINHEKTMLAITAERSLLKYLGGGCQVPMGAVTKFNGKDMVLRAAVLSPDGRKRVGVERKGSADGAEKIGRSAGKKLLAGGGDVIMKEVLEMSGS